MRPKISVIVPIYNAELYLEQCIESVLNQTLRDIELLLIDDGSTDNSFLICEKYKKRDNRIQLYTNKNVGQGLERNFGIKKSTGEYIAFLDSDDQYKENICNFIGFDCVYSFKYYHCRGLINNAY